MKKEYGEMLMLRGINNKANFRVVGFVVVMNAFHDGMGKMPAS